MLEFLRMIRKVLMWVEVQPGVHDRIRDGYECRIRDYRYNVMWTVTQDFHRFDVIASGVCSTVAEAKSEALAAVKASRESASKDKDR